MLHGWREWLHEEPSGMYDEAEDVMACEDEGTLVSCRLDELQSSSTTETTEQRLSLEVS